LSSPHRQPPARVPTLTEVVALEDTAQAGDPGSAQDLAERTVDEAQRGIDSMFEQRLREALAPGVEALLQKLSDQFHREFESLLHDAVARALAQVPSKPP
jgi:hypothetical protein